MPPSVMGSSSRWGPEPQALARLLQHLERFDRLVDRREVQRVVDPPALLPGMDHSGILQRSQVERQQRLSSPERPGEVTDALFAVPETLDAPQTRLVGQGVEPTT